MGHTPAGLCGWSLGRELGQNTAGARGHGHFLAGCQRICWPEREGGGYGQALAFIKASCCWPAGRSPGLGTSVEQSCRIRKG